MAAEVWRFGCALGAAAVWPPRESWLVGWWGGKVLKGCAFVNQRERLSLDEFQENNPPFLIEATKKELPKTYGNSLKKFETLPLQPLHIINIPNMFIYFLSGKVWKADPCWILQWRRGLRSGCLEKTATLSCSSNQKMAAENILVLVFGHIKESIHLSYPNLGENGPCQIT